MNDYAEPLSVRIPADVEQPDKIMYGLTGRQLVLLAATALLAAAVFVAGSSVLPLAVVVGLVFPAVASGLLLALGRRDGMGLDRFVVVALQHFQRNRKLVNASEGVVAPPRWCRVRGRLPEPMRLPVRTTREDGVLELDGGGTAALVRAGTVSFGLRTDAEQASLVGFFGRWLNSLEAPVQILVQARPVDLSELTARVDEAAATLPHPALRQAAEGHAAYLDELSQSRSLLAREVLIVLREPSAGGSGSRGHRGKARDANAAIVARRAAETVRALAGFGISAEQLDAEAALRVLSKAFSPTESRPVPAPDINAAVAARPLVVGP
ncbi:PrgI family protein [Actinomadura sp. SCN-SB]|uniref:PrgI family protein n=1 Tax=Actinomadura sp. SCN-SB TaxID=3373092 RepID=UPI003750ACCA